RRIREHLRILDLPEPLWPQVADAAIPLAAVRPLAQLAKAHTGLPAVAVKRVLSDPPVPWGRDITWSDVAHDAVAVVAGQYDDQATELPDDVFVGGVAYRLARFQLREQATKDAEEALPPEGSDARAAD